MTSSRQFNESEGEFTGTQRRAPTCLSCKSGNVTCNTWESSDGAYEDYKFICQDCGYVWWIDGIDS